MRVAALASVVLLAFGGPVTADDTVENPEFTNWSKFKKGTSITLQSIATVNGKPAEQTLTETLVEVADDKVAIVTEVIVVVRGNTIKPNALRREVLKTIALAKGAKKEDVLAGRPTGTTDEGTETIDVCGTKMKTRWFKFKTESANLTTEGKVWIADGVPGRVVKSERNAGGSVPTASSMQLIEIKKP